MALAPPRPCSGAFAHACRLPQPTPPHTRTSDARRGLEKPERKCSRLRAREGEREERGRADPEVGAKEVQFSRSGAPEESRLRGRGPGGGGRCDWLATAAPARIGFCGLSCELTARRLKFKSGVGGGSAWLLGPSGSRVLWREPMSRRWSRDPGTLSAAFASRPVRTTMDVQAQVSAAAAGGLAPRAEDAGDPRPGVRSGRTVLQGDDRTASRPGRVRAGDTPRARRPPHPQTGRRDVGPPFLSCRRGDPVSLALSTPSPFRILERIRRACASRFLTDRLVGEARDRRGLVACPPSTFFLLMSGCVCLRFAAGSGWRKGRGEIGGNLLKGRPYYSLVRLSFAQLDWLISVWVPFTTTI